MHGGKAISLVSGMAWERQTEGACDRERVSCCIICVKQRQTSVSALKLHSALSTHELECTQHSVHSTSCALEATQHRVLQTQSAPCTRCSLLTL